MRLILASASPRRAALLREAGYAFVVESADVDEARHLGTMPPRELAEFLAGAKAEAVARRFPHDVTLAADTVVAVGDVALGKPDDAAGAREMIRMLSGGTHEVFTGVAVRLPEAGLELNGVATSEVRMRPLSEEEIERYLAFGRWRGKAGGYGIQDAEPIVRCVRGGVSNVVGLPMELTREFLDRAGVGRAGSA